VRGNPRDAQGPGISDDLQQHAPLRPGASPSGRARTQFTLRDYLPEACAPGPPQRIQSAAPLDPIAWRAAILADTSRPPPPLQRLSPKVQRPPCSQPSRLQPRTQPFRPGTADACVRLSVEPQQQPALPQQRASPPLTAPIPCRIFLAHWKRYQRTSVRFGRDSKRRHTDHRHRLGRAGAAGRRGQRLKVQLTDQRQLWKILLSKRLGSHRHTGQGSCRIGQSFWTSCPAQLAALGHPLLQGRGGGWFIPRPRSRSVASALHARAREGPTSSRVPEFHRNHGVALWDSERAGPLSVRMVSGVQSIEEGAWDKGGTAHRTVLWGRHVTTVLGEDAGASRAQTSSAVSASQQLAGAPVMECRSTWSGLTGQHCTGRPSAVHCNPSLEIPERGGGD
jgi:hypothetical protein